MVGAVPNPQAKCMQHVAKGSLPSLHCLAQLADEAHELPHLC